MRFKAIVVLFVIIAMGLVTLKNPGRAEADVANPFLAESTLPFHAPPFDKIKDSDYQPAIEAGMKDQLAEIEKIANDPTPATFANTLEAMERSGALLTRVTKVFFNLTTANTSDTLQKIKSEEAPKLASHSDAIFLNSKLFARVKAIYDQRDALKLDAESRYLIERYYKTFIRSGVLSCQSEFSNARDARCVHTKQRVSSHEVVVDLDTIPSDVRERTAQTIDD